VIDGSHRTWPGRANRVDTACTAGRMRTPARAAIMAEKTPTGSPAAATTQRPSPASATTQRPRCTQVSFTGYKTFDTTLEKTNGVLKHIEESYGWPKTRRNQSYGGLRAVLHALRDRLTVEETAHLSAQLPMLIRGIYFEGWDPSKVPVKMHRDDFLERIREEFPYEVPGGTERLVEVVTEALRRHITEGEWQNVRAGLPKDMVAVLP
jgi:uncharacterized protein (DUF2267 family)